MMIIWFCTSIWIYYTTYLCLYSIMKSRRFLYRTHLILLVIRTGFVVNSFLTSSVGASQTTSSSIHIIETISTRWNNLLQTNNSTEISENEAINNFLEQENSLTGDGSLESTDRMSLNDIIASINTQDLSGYLISTKELEQQYRSTNDPELGIQFITRLTKEFNYKQAYKELQTLDSITIKKMNPHLVLRIFFNSELINNKTQNLTLIENMIGEFSATNLITKPETQRYKALLMLIKWDKTNFLVNLPTFDKNSTSEIKNVVNDIRIKAQKTTQWHDIPAYYTDGIITLSLFQYGYPYLAQQLSLNILTQYPNYILPQQILAYSHMILHEWSQAQSYFLQLISNDNKNIHNYQFFAWVCSYWLGKYTDAILYLNQIPTNKIVSDTIRYKILSYLAIQDYTNTAKQMKYLLWQTDVNNSDMMLIWEHTVFIPYMYGKSYTILDKDNSILDLYIERCNNQSFDPIICQIGKLAKDVNLRLTSYSDTYLKSIITNFPRSYIYYLLWDYYLKKWNSTEAQKAFITALSLSTDPEVRKKITAKIKGIL